MTDSSQFVRVEWTGAGGDYYLAIAVNELNEVVSECWGTRKTVTAWIADKFPDATAQYAPMALGATRRKRRKPPEVVPPGPMKKRQLKTARS